MTADFVALRGEIRRRDTTPERLLEIAALDPQLSRSVAQAKTTPPEVLDRLAHSSDMPTRARVAGHPRAPATALAHLLGDPQWTVLKALVDNPALPAEVARQLSRHRSSSVRMAALGAGLQRGVLAQSDWERLLADPDEKVRTAMANWEGLDAAQAAGLLRDPSPEVRRIVLARQAGVIYLRNNQKIPQVAQPLAAEQIRPLLDDDNGEVRLAALRALAKLHFDFLTLPAAQRQKLVLDEEPRVAEEILRKLWGGWFSAAEGEVRQDTLARLRHHPAEVVRLLALRLLDAGSGEQAILRAFADDPGDSVRAEVAARVSDPATLRRLARDENWGVRSYITFNPHAPRELLLEVVETLERPLTFRALWAGDYVVPLLAHPNLTEADLRALLADDGPLTRAPHKVELNYIYRDHRDVWNKILRILVKSRDPDVLRTMLQWLPPADIRAELKIALEQHAPQLLPEFQRKYER